jgi:hypothetical protein
MTTKVLVTLRGGLIETISANNPDVEITVADYDNTDCYEKPKDLFQYYKSKADHILKSIVIDGQINQMEEDFKNELETS